MLGRLLLGFALFLVATPSLAARPDGEADRSSVVKIFTTARMPNLSQPWTRRSPTEATGSGVVISGNRILTNSHVVNYAKRILVQPYQSSEKYEGHVVAIARGIDLALIQLEDESFFETHPAAELTSEFPRIGSTVQAIGYPMGGDALSVTEGIVSRIEYTDYNGITRGLRMQVDTALNPGNSGGPVFMGDRVIGLVFSGIPSAENIGYVIPTDEVEMFLADVEDGSYEGNPRLFSRLQTAENPALRKRLGLSHSDTGLIVTDADEDSVLHEWDLLEAIGDHDIDNRGMVDVEGGYRFHFGYYVPKLAHDGVVPVTVIRDGKRVEIDLPVKVKPNRLMVSLDGAYPSYLIHGPMVFSPVYAELAQAATRVGPMLAVQQNPIVERLSDEPAFEGEQLVVLPSPFFPHRTTKGYSLGILPVLESVNGIKVKNLAHLAEILRDAEGEFIEFKFAGQTNETLVFNREQLESATEDILDDAGIRSRASDDILPILEQ